MAAPVAARRRPGHPARLLEASSGGHARAALLACRQAKIAETNTTRRRTKPGGAHRTAPGTESFGPERTHDALCDLARRIQSLALSLHRTGRHGGRRTVGKPQPGGDRGTDRLFRQHGAPAHRPFGKPDVNLKPVLAVVNLVS